MLKKAREARGRDARGYPPEWEGVVESESGGSDEGRRARVFEALRCCLIDDFCCGCSLLHGMTFVASAFVAIGVMLLTIFAYLFISYGYFSLEEDYQTTSQSTTLADDEIHTNIGKQVAGATVVGYLMELVLLLGVAADVLLLYAIRKRWARLVGLWALALAARAATLLAIAPHLWTLCDAGGRLCDMLRSAALLWFAGTGVYVYVVVAAYSLAQHLRELPPADALPLRRQMA